MNKHKLLSSLILFLLFSVTSFSTDLTVTHLWKTRWNPDGSNRYDVFSTIPQDQLLDSTTANFYVNYRRNANCYFFVTFSKGHAGSYDRYLSEGANQLYYQLYTSASKTNILMEAPDASTSNILSGQIVDTRPPREYPLEYYWEIFPGQLVPPGTYEDEVTVRVYEGTLTGSYQERSSCVVLYKAIVERMLQMKITGSDNAIGGSPPTHSLDFGEGSAGDSKTINLYVRSNAGYSIKLKSQNKGQLYREDNFRNKPEYKIDYTLDFNGSTVNLDSNTYVTVETYHGMTTAEGNVMPITVTLGSLEEKFAGNYSDVIEVVAQAVD